ncbi:MAG: PD-(D/E)XK motif protein [Dehalococcoidia bacterium]
MLFVESDRRSYEPALRTGHISLRLHQRFQMAGVGIPPTTAMFHALQCETSDQDDINTFLLLVDAFIREHTDRQPTGESLSMFFRSMVRLFSTDRARDLDAERQGLWGELFVMNQVRGVEFRAPFWHSDPKRRFDFSSARRRVEVKTTVGAERIHHFAHGQLFAPPDLDIMIASLLLLVDDVGLSLRQLIDQSSVALRSPADLLKLERAVRLAGMESLDERGPAFDLDHAERSLTWYRAGDAPHFRVPEPAGVSDTRYRVDLSGASAVGDSELDEWLNGWPSGQTTTG